MTICEKKVEEVVGGKSELVVFILGTCVSCESFITRINMYKSLVESLKRQATTWEKASANHLFGKGLDPKYIETSKLKNKNTNNLMRNRTKDLNTSPNIYRRQISTGEDAQHPQP